MVGLFNKRDEELPSLLFFSQWDDDFVKASIYIELNHFCTMTFTAGRLFNPRIIFVEAAFLEEFLVEGGINQYIETRRKPRTGFLLQR